MDLLIALTLVSHFPVNGDSDYDCSSALPFILISSTVKLGDFYEFHDVTAFLSLCRNRVDSVV